jgi:hypothetical protein
MTIWRRNIPRWVPKLTNTHSEYVELIAFPLHQWLHEHASTSRYTYTGLSCVYLNTAVRDGNEP